MTRKRFKKLIQAHYTKSYLEMIRKYPDFYEFAREEFQYWMTLLRDAKFENLKVKSSYKDAYEDFMSRVEKDSDD